jgi:hypothetical protein
VQPLGAVALVVTALLNARLAGKPVPRPSTKRWPLGGSLPGVRVR